MRSEVDIASECLIHSIRLRASELDWDQARELWTNISVVAGLSAKELEGSTSFEVVMLKRQALRKRYWTMMRR